MAELRLDGRVALVTGAGRGLGRAHARALAAHGALVVVNDPGVSLEGDGSDHQPAEQVVKEIRDAGGQAVANFGSVAEERDTAEMVEQALSSFGAIDIVVNNAGNFVPRCDFAVTSTESFDRIWRVHLMGSINVIRAAWPHMVARHHGRIINTTSHTALLGSARNVEYAAAKGALFGLTNALAIEAAEHGIAINAIAPGALTRPVTQIEGVADRIPDGAFDPDLAAPIVVWLAHQDCPANGETFGTMSGLTSRIKVCETMGYFGIKPTAEDIRDNFDAIMGDQAIEQTGLRFGELAELHGLELMQQYVAATR